MKHYKILLMSSITACGMVGPSLALGATEDNARQLEEIVITAQKRAASLQDTPMSVTAITGDTLAKNGDITVEDIALSTPGLVVGGNAAFEYSISIRGISSAAAGIGADTPIGTYVDGVYLGRPIGAMFDLADIERIEVLRGPQGTLYGRNTVGGAISIYTGRPSDELGGTVKGTIAQRGNQRISGLLTGPLVDGKLNGKISASYSKTGDWVTNLTGPDILSTNSFTTRASLDLIANDTVSFLLRADYGNVDDPLYSKNISKAIVSPPQVTPDLIDDFDTVSLSETNLQAREFWGTSLHSSFQLGDYQLTSITAYRKNTHIYQLDTDGSPLRIFRSGHNEKQNQFSQELQLTSPGDQTVDWILGAYYFTESASQNFYVEVIPISTNFGRFSKNKTTSLAAFGQADWHLSDKITATLGLRYSYETKNFSFAFQPTALTADQIGAPGDPLNRLPRSVAFTLNDQAWSALTGKIGLSWQVDDETLVYGSISQGFKSGGFNFAPTNPTGDAPFDQEKVTAYEIGAKTDLLNQSLRVNASAFYYSYNNLQVRIPISPGVILIENASDAEVYGAEVELMAQPTDRLFIRGSLSLLKTKYKEFIQSGGIIPLCTGGEQGVNNGVSFCDVSGNDLNRAPGYTFNISADYEIPVGQAWTLIPRVAYSYEDKVFYTEQNDPEFGHNGVENLDASLTLRPSRENFSIMIYGRNLTDDRIYTHIIPIATAAIASGVNQPRTFGISFEVDF